MDFDTSEWLNLIIRWVHVFAGILWIGSTWFFTWLDGRLEDTEENAGGKVWMVHSGGFYIVEKTRVPEVMPKKLHWFQWEAAITWISGILLLAIVYYMGGIVTDESVSEISFGAAVALGVGLVVVGWLVYDLLWLSPLGKYELAATLVSYALVVAVAFGLTRVLSARAAYMHVGALLGTLMAANVWLRILPAQRAMIAATREGKQPDPVLGARAKGRSKHNTYMVMPLVFIMLSNHFPTASYGHEYNWVVLAVLVLAAWGVVRFIRGQWIPAARAAEIPRER